MIKWNIKLQLLQHFRILKTTLKAKSTEDQQHRASSFESGESRKLVSKIVQPCPPHFPVGDNFYLLDVWRITAMT